MFGYFGFYFWRPSPVPYGHLFDQYPQYTYDYLFNKDPQDNSASTSTSEDNGASNLTAEDNSTSTSNLEDNSTSPSNSEVVINSNSDGTTDGLCLPDLEEGKALAPEMINGIVDQNFLRGDGSSTFKVTLLDTGFVGYSSALGVYEIDASGTIVDPRILFDNTNADKSASARVTEVEEGNYLGFFLVSNAADWAATLGDNDNLSFVNYSNEPAKVSDEGGFNISIAVNGTRADIGIEVYHSFSENLNILGEKHVISCVNDDVAGKSMTIAFEDMSDSNFGIFEDIFDLTPGSCSDFSDYFGGGSDWDYNDVMFRVEVVD